MPIFSSSDIALNIFLQTLATTSAQIYIGYTMIFIPVTIIQAIALLNPSIAPIYRSPTT